MRIGVVADTHGTVPASLEEAFEGVERIIHAGDIGGQRVLDELGVIAPVVAVRGNMDTGELEWRLSDTATIRLDGKRIMVVHKGDELRRVGAPASVDIVVSGHTHRSSVERMGDTLFVNPGSAGGHNRDDRGPTAAIIDLGADPPEAFIVEL